MNAPVLWVSRHAHILARSYADQGALEAILDRSLWKVPGGVTYEHHEAIGENWPALPGAIAVLPARHHVQDLKWFLDHLRALEWSVVILAGDEEWDFPWRKITEARRRRVWTMQPIPPHARYSGVLPGGWSPGTRESLAGFASEAAEKPLDWAFAGQVTHSRREQCVSVLCDLPNGKLIETDGYMQGIPIEDYRKLIASAKVIPSPSGPFTVDTNRPLEAMECGAVPVLDTLTPRMEKGFDQPFDYWKLVFGEHPLPTVKDWAEFPAVMESILADWPKASNRVFSWWQLHKRELCHHMDADVRAVSGIAQTEGPSDLITAIVTTSPIDAHPDTSMIEETIASVRAQLPDAEILVVADGVRPEQAHLEADYQEYLRRLLWKCNFDWHNVVPLLLPEWGHQANATRAALELVQTPLILFMEHDTPVMGDIDWAGLARVVRNGDAEHIRFHIYDEIHPAHLHMMLGDVEDVGGVPLWRTAQFWARPHLASAQFYRQKVMPHFPETSRTMVEDVMHGVVESNWLDHGKEGWRNYRLSVYCPRGGYRRSGHLDGRGGAPKFEMKYVE